MYEKNKHTKLRYDKIGDPRGNKRVKAHVGDVIEIVGTTIRGQVIRITNSKKTDTNKYGEVYGKYSDWFYKIRFENRTRERWLMATPQWRVIEDADKDTR